MEPGDARLLPWQTRLEELESFLDPVDQLLAEIESSVSGPGTDSPRDPGQLELFRASAPDREETHQVRLQDGKLLRGTWTDIVRQMRDLAGFRHESITQYMRRLAELWHEQGGAEIPSNDPGSFLRAAIRAGLLTLEEDFE
jgi:hypothetical protein